MVLLYHLFYFCVAISARFGPIALTPFVFRPSFVFASHFGPAVLTSLVFGVRKVALYLM